MFLSIVWLMIISRVLVLYDGVRLCLRCFKNRQLVLFRLLIQYQHAGELASIYVTFLQRGLV